MCRENAIDIATLSYVYRSIVEPHFHLCCSVLGGCENPWNLLQHRAARIVTNSSYDAPVDALIQKLKWPAMTEIIK